MIPPQITRALVYTAAVVLPVLLTAALNRWMDDWWHPPYPLQYITIIIGLSLLGGFGPGMVALTISSVALVWLGVLVNPGVWLFVAVNAALVSIIRHRASVEVALRRSVAELQRAQVDLEAATTSADRARASAEEANRAKDRFLAVLSHELRTPLAPVLAGITLLERDTSLSAQAQSFITVFKRNIELEAHLIDDLLDVTRITRGKVELTKKPVELREVLDRAVDVCRPDIVTRRLEFGVDYRIDGPCFVEADEPRLQQVFWNLLKNAIKFTPKGGCVGILAAIEHDEVVVRVMDSGIGIESTDLVSIFDAFAQGERATEHKFGGLGLGLTIVRALVERHNGTVRALSEGKGRGATFEVRLPVLTLAAAANAAAQRQVEPSRRSLHVLLVEDHGDTAAMVSAMLRHGGHTVEISGDATVALDTIGRDGFDLLVSDLGLPDISGHELLRLVRSRGYHTPAIALSGYGQESDVRQSLHVGFAAHLVKPVTMDRLLEAIETVVAERH